MAQAYSSLAKWAASTHLCLDGRTRRPIVDAEGRDVQERDDYQERRVNGRWMGTVQTEAKVLAYSDPEVGDDLALLEVLQDNFTDVSAEFDDSGNVPLKIGTEIVHVGCTLGLYDSTSYGIISQTDRDLIGTGKVFDQTSCMGYPGSSGGGVYLKNGKCVGLLVQRFRRWLELHCPDPPHVGVGHEVQAGVGD